VCLPDASTDASSVRVFGEGDAVAGFAFPVVSEMAFFPAGGVIAVDVALGLIGGDLKPPRIPEMARFRTGVVRTGDGTGFASTGAFVMTLEADAFRTGTGF
jgi:hypothetical protein